MPRAKGSVVTADDEVFMKTLQSADNLSTTDRMGAVAKKAVELMQTLIRSDADPQQVFFAADSLKAERELVMRWDEESKSPLRQKLYTLFESLETALRWYAEREKKLKGEAGVKKEEPQEISDTTGSSLFTVSAVGTSAVKEEEDQGMKKKGKNTSKKEEVARKIIKIKEEMEDNDEDEDQSVKKNRKTATSKKDEKKKTGITIKEEIEDDDDEDQNGKKNRKDDKSKKDEKKRKRLKIKEELDDDDEEDQSAKKKRKDGRSKKEERKRIKEETDDEDDDHETNATIHGAKRKRVKVKQEIDEDEEDEEMNEEEQERMKKRRNEWKNRNDTRKRFKIKVEEEDSDDMTLIVDTVTSPESVMARRVRKKIIRDFAHCFDMSFEDPVWLKDEDVVEFSEWMEYWESPEGIKKGGPPKTHETNLTIDMKKEKSVYKSEDIEDARKNNESVMAREVRLKLERDYADCGMGFDDSIWLKDEDAMKFRDWMH